jgi:hypothetical protein
MSVPCPDVGHRRVGDDPGHCHRPGARELVGRRQLHDPEKLIAHYEAFGMGDMAEGLGANDLLYAQTWGALAVHRIDYATETRLTALLEATLSHE